MEAASAARARAQTRWSATRLCAARDPPRDSLSDPQWLRLARAAARDLPPYGIVYHDFRLWRKDGTWETIHDRLREQVREAAGKPAEPSVGILDSQSVKTAEKGGRTAMMPARRSTAASATC